MSKFNDETQRETTGISSSISNHECWRMANSCFSDKNEIQFRWSWWLPEVLAHKIFSMHCGKGSLMVWGRAFSSSGKLKLKFVSGCQKGADYVKMLNDLSLAQEEHCLCREG